MPACGAILDLPDPTLNNDIGSSDGSTNPDGQLGDGMLQDDAGPGSDGGPGNTDGSGPTDSGEAHSMCNGKECFGGGCSLNQCQPYPLSTAFASPRAIAFDSSSSKIFVVDSTSGIDSVDLGGNVVQLATTEHNLISDIKASSAGVFFANNGNGSTGSELVSRCTTSSCAGPMRTNYVTSKYGVGGIAIDSTNLYVSQSDSSVSNGGIFTCPLSGTTCGAANPAVANSGLIGASAGTFYWLESNGTGFSSCSGSTCAATEGNNFGVLSFTVTDSTNIYFGTATGIYFVAKPGIAAGSKILSGNEVTSVATDGTTLYWIDVSGTAGTLYTCETASCTTLSALASLADPDVNALAISADSIYYTTRATDHTLWRLAR